ncbi:TPA: hypothetical protein I8P22_002414 [Salmonella enterica subsp. enterica serovar Napoli]|nr:hypothetical protein [Salmonella enterica subsp. enterica serovar Napoli]
MTDKDNHYRFLRDHYKHERFEGRNSPVWGHDYAAYIERSARESLEKYGFSVISCHESKTGEAIFYDRKLNVLKGEQIKRALHGAYMKANKEKKYE